MQEHRDLVVTQEELEDMGVKERLWTIDREQMIARRGI
jgi:hypothetical protein